MALEADGWSAIEAHQSALSQLGAASVTERSWIQYIGFREVLPAILGFLALLVQIAGVAGWHRGLYLSWLIAGVALVAGGPQAKQTFSRVATLWRGPWSKIPISMVVIGGVVGFIVGFEPI